MCGNSVSRVKYYWPLFQAIVQTQRGWERWGEFMISHTFICLVQWSPMPFWSLYRQKNKYSDVGWLHQLEKSIWLGSSWCFVLWNGSGPSKDSLFFTQPLQVLIATWKHCDIAIEKSGMTILRKFLRWHTVEPHNERLILNTLILAMPSALKLHQKKSCDSRTNLSVYVYLYCFSFIYSTLSTDLLPKIPHTFSEAKWKMSNYMQTIC